MPLLKGASTLGAKLALGRIVLDEGQDAQVRELVGHYPVEVWLNPIEQVGVQGLLEGYEDLLVVAVACDLVLGLLDMKLKRIVEGTVALARIIQVANKVLSSDVPESLLNKIADLLDALRLLRH